MSTAIAYLGKGYKKKLDIVSCFILKFFKYFALLKKMNHTDSSFVLCSSPYLLCSSLLPTPLQILISCFILIDLSKLFLIA